MSETLVGTLPHIEQARHLSKEVSVRFDILRTILIFGLVWLHVPPHIEIGVSSVSAPDSLLIYSQILIGNVLFRAALPCLSVISGYLLFLHYKKKSYWHLLLGKTRNIFVPLALWNLALLVPYTLLSSHGFIQLPDRMEYLEDGLFGGYLDALFGWGQAPLNLPTAFLRDLFVSIILSPVLYLFLKKAPWIGLLLAGFLTFLVGPTLVLLRPEILFYMYCGGLWVMHGQYMWQIIDRLAWWLVSIAAAMTALVALYGHHIATQDDITVPIAFGPLMAMFKPFAVLGFFALSGLLWRTQWAPMLAKGAKWTFFIFCAHSPLQVFTWFFLKNKLENATSTTFTLYFLIAPFVTVAICWGSYRLMEYFLPQCLRVLTGNRKPRMA